MTSSEINAAIFRHLHNDEPFSVLCQPCFGNGTWGFEHNNLCDACGGTGKVEPCYIGPNYHGDLNAMHEAERTLEYPKDGQFTNELEGMCKRDKRLSHFCMSAAPQRAEAFLRTIGKWVESLSPSPSEA